MKILILVFGVVLHSLGVAPLLLEDPRPAPAAAERAEVSCDPVNSEPCTAYDRVNDDVQRPSALRSAPSALPPAASTPAIPARAASLMVMQPDDRHWGLRRVHGTRGPPGIARPERWHGGAEWASEP